MEFPPVGAYSKILAASTTSNESPLPSAPPIIGSSTPSVTSTKGSVLASAGTASSVIAAGFDSKEPAGKIDPSYATTTTYDMKLAPGGFDTTLYGSISSNSWPLPPVATGRFFSGNPYGGVGNGAADAYMSDVAGAGMSHAVDGGGLNAYSTPLCGAAPSDSVYSSMAASWTQYGYLPTSTFDENQLGAGRLSSLYGHVSDSAVYNMQRGTDAMSSSSLLTTDASAAQLALPGIGTHLNSGTIDLCQGPSLLSHPTSNLDYLQRGLQSTNNSTPLFSDASMVMQPNGHGSMPVSYFHHDKEDEQQLYGLPGINNNSNHQHQQQILDLATAAYHQPPFITVGGHLQHPPLTSSTPMLNMDGSCTIGTLPVPPPSSQTTVASTDNLTSTPAATRGRSANGRRRAKSSATASSSRLCPTVATKNLEVLPHSSGAPPPHATIEGRDCGAATGGKGGLMTPGMAGGRGKSGRPGRSCSSYNNSDDDSLEGKEVERRTANNTRERIRVRDINAAFKELAKLCAQHIPNTEERGLTKLGTLLKAVDLIPTLEAKVRERNMDPKCANSMMNLRRDNSQSIVDNSHQSFGSSCSSG